jgi:hypothetical protein
MMAGELVERWWNGRCGALYVWDGSTSPQLNFDEVLTTGTPDGQVTVIVTSALWALKFTTA